MDHVALGQDSVGVVKITKGQDHVDIAFAKAYQDKPVVNANIIDDKITAAGLVEQIEADVCAYGDTLEACQAKMQQHLRSTDVSDCQRPCKTPYSG